jgi:hypothetical protein
MSNNRRTQAGPTGDVLWQHHLIVNLDKRQCLEPHDFGDQATLTGFGHQAQGTLTALAVLLARDNGFGAGDVQLPHETPDRALIGSWAGDRIAIVGDLAPSPALTESDELEFFASTFGSLFAVQYPNRRPNPYHLAQAVFENISDRLIALLQIADGDRSKLRHIDLDDGHRSRFEMVVDGRRLELDAAEKVEHERVRELVLEEFSRMPVERIAELLQRRAESRW